VEKVDPVLDVVLDQHPLVSSGQSLSHYRRASRAFPRSVDRGFGSLSLPPWQA
jgi:hypothetical protein